MGQNIKTAIFGDDGAGISNGKLGLGEVLILNIEKITRRILS